MRTAAIGIGSNSLRMLVADITEKRLHRLRRYREGLRVFAALDANRNITDDMIKQACISVEQFRQEALKQGAEHIHLFATSAVRDAANQEMFSSALKGSTGLSLDICSGEVEAQLSFLGAAEDGLCGLIDIGGGSTEIVIGEGTSIKQAVSLQMGAVRLCRMRAIESVSDAYEVLALAQRILEPERERFLACNAQKWIGVGGTFTTAAALIQRIPWDQRENIHGFVMPQKAVQDAMEFLAPMPLEERLKLPYLQPQRADIVVHGAAILLACMRMLNISQIQVSEYGNLEGYLKMQYLTA